MNKKTVALTKEQYKLIINTIREGFIDNNKPFRPNNRLATILVLQANLGLRISDILNLKLNSFVKDGNRYRLDIIEQKTSKTRTFTVPTEIYNFIKMYVLENKIKPTARIFPIGERAVQKQLKLVVEHLGLSNNISTHSFRKYYATEIYINNNYNIALVKELLQHSSVSTTQRYIGVGQQELEQAIENHICLL